MTASVPVARLKRFLVALDSSPRASAVLTTAVELARLAGASLILYRAVSVPADLPRAALANTDQRLEDFLVAHGREELSRMAAAIAAPRVELIVAFATAWDGICRQARESDVDVIVIGAHGYGHLSRLLGTTAAKVVDHADRHVFVVRERS